MCVIYSNFIFCITIVSYTTTITPPWCVVVAFRGRIIKRLYSYNVQHLVSRVTTWKLQCASNVVNRNHPKYISSLLGGCMCYYEGHIVVSTWLLTTCNSQSENALQTIWTNWNNLEQFYFHKQDIIVCSISFIRRHSNGTCRRHQKAKTSSKFLKLGISCLD